MEGPILIVGASARAAADSARRAGLDPMAIDLFGDRDLSARPAARIPLTEYPEGICRLARSFPPGPFLYTGALENHPSVIAELAESRPLWGNPPAVLDRVRDPFLVREVLREAGVPAPRCLPGIDPPPTGGRWLEKPLRGGGGRGIRPASPEGPRHASSYFQEWIEGTPASAVYTADRGAARLLGLTRQVVGNPAFGARPFHYSGSIGPLSIGKVMAERLETIGGALTAAFGLRGLFGVDLLMRGGVPWPVEVNPRYSASVEVLEMAGGFAVLADHAAVFSGKPEGAGGLSGAPRRECETCPGGFVGKAILHARAPVEVPRGLEEGLWAADLPQAGERIGAGRPVLTVFARSDSVEGCRRALARAAREVYRRLESSADSSASRSPPPSSCPPHNPRAPRSGVPGPGPPGSPGP